MMKYIFSAFLLLFSRVLTAQLPSGEFTSHTDGQTVTNAAITITWKGCSNAAQDSYQTRVNGVPKTTTQSSSFPCPDYSIGKTYSASGTLAIGSNHLFLRVCDISGCGEKVITVYLSAPGVTVTPDGTTAAPVNEGAMSSSVFKVKNTGTEPGTPLLTYACTAELTLCPAPDTSTLVQPGDSVMVSFSYTGATPGDARATLRARYNEFPSVSDTGYVNVLVNPAPAIPTATIDSHTHNQTVNAPNITITWTGCSVGAPNEAVTQLNDTILATTATGLGPDWCYDNRVRKEYSASSTLRTGPNTIFVKTCDVNGCGNTTITVRYDPPSASVAVTPVQPTQVVTAGETIIQFDVENTSQNTSVESAFTLSATPTGSVGSCWLSPTSVTLSPGAPPARVNANCTITTIGTAGSVKLIATAESPTFFSDEGTANVTVAPVYRIAISPAVSSASVNPGTTNTHSVVIQNTSSNSALPITVSLPSPSCSGVTLGSCAVGGTSVSIAQGSQTSAITLSYTAIASGYESVILAPSGTVSGGSVQVTNGTLNVTVGGGTGSTLTVAIAGRNPGTTIDKAGCLTVAAGQNAAYECADLRVAHPLPMTSTMDRARGPALIYNSRHANPNALLAADLTYSGTAPTTLKATVVMAGQTDLVRDFPWNPACSSACRIVVPLATTQPTGVYPVTLTVSAMNGAATLVNAAAVTDTIVVVNRAASPFGSGWWVDGLESLVTLSATKILWIGGDGSTRVYSQSGTGDIYIVTPAYDRPDTLTRVPGTSQTWRRQLGDGAFVEFNSDGRHVKTENALGWKTIFAYEGGLLQSITLPVPSSSAEVRPYRFWYTSSLLDSVQAPNANVSRTTRVARNGNRLDSIIDPGSPATTFGYDAYNRITSRRNKLGDTTYFQYDAGGALKQSRLSTARTDGAGSAITTNFRAAETRSAYNTNDPPSLPSLLYTQIDGPRTDVADTTNIIVNRWGAPDSVTNAIGQRTRVTRGNTTFPALATKVVAANGLETRAFFNARGLPDSTVAVDPYNTGQNASTRYFWNPTWNQPDSVVRPMGERTRTFYRTSRPIVDSMRTGSNTARRVKFTYTADNQVQGVTEPGLPDSDSVTYDNLGNTSRTWTPMGRAAAAPYFTEFMKDAIGRDTLVVTPDSTGRTRLLYDAADRVIRSTSDGPARPYSLPLNASFLPDTAVVGALARTDSSGYDAEGNLVFKRGVSSVGDVQVNESMTYDAAGQLRKRQLGTGPDSMVYDPAGNLVSARHRSGAWVTQSYDVLNRLTTRVIPEVSYAQQGCVGFVTTGPLSCLMVFPYYPNSGTSLRIAADTARFVYDSFGNMTQANNRYARIRRTYYRGGALKTDTTGIGGVSNPLVDNSKSGQIYTYDLSGRRTQMEWGLGPTSYTYNDFGALNTVTSLNGHQFRFVYTLAGQIDSLLLGTGVKEKRSYDDDGRRTFRTRVSSVLNLLERLSQLRQDESDPTRVAAGAPAER
jgi:YD repeat-containing protein